MEHCFEYDRSAGPAQKSGYRVRDFGGVFNSTFFFRAESCIVSVPKHVACRTVDIPYQYSSKNSVRSVETRQRKRCAAGQRLEAGVAKLVLANTG